jgi:CheY-like chemotaxis protein
VALVDIGLPGIDGYEVARRLRMDPATRGVKLIALTGYGLAEDQRRVLEAGFDLHLVKPVGIDQLLDALGTCDPLAEAAK